MVARDRLARGVRLNYPETVALLSTWVIERAREGASVVELMESGRTVLDADQVMDGVPEMIHDVRAGHAIAGRLAGLGIGTVRELAESPDGPLVAQFGPNTGPHLGRLGRGAGSAIVDATPWVARAHGRETTYQRNLTTPQEVAGALRTLADQVVQDLRREGRGCSRVHLKVRFAPFYTVTRVRKLAEPTDDASVITQTALDLLHRLEDDRPIRLLGVRAEMVPPQSGYDEPRTHGRRGGP